MNSFGKNLAKLSQVGINMLVTIGICFFIGKWLDNVFNTNILFLSIFIILGVGAAFRNLYVIVMLEYKKEEEKEKKQNYIISNKKNDV